MSGNWCSCFTNTCLQQQTYQVTPGAAHFPAQQIQQYPYQPQPLQQPSRIMAQPSLAPPSTTPLISKLQPSPIQSKIAASQIKTQDPVQLSHIKDTSIIRSQIPVKQGIEDSIIYGKFDSLLHGSVTSMIDVNVSGSQTKPEQPIAPIMNVKPPLNQIQMNNFTTQQFVQPKPMVMQVPAYNQINRNVYPQQQFSRRF